LCFEYILHSGLPHGISVMDFSIDFIHTRLMQSQIEAVTIDSNVDVDSSALRY
jgi:hypothetical protein